MSTVEKATTIRPAILVSVRSTVSGGVSYERQDLNADSPSDGSVVVNRWETTKTVQDPVEHEAATKARSAALRGIRKLCTLTGFGLLCPLASEEELDKAIRESREIVMAFNAKATHTRINVNTLKGKIATSDAEAARAILSETAEMIEAMDKAIDRMDVKAIRDLATKANGMSTMVSPELSDRVTAAVDTARKAARMIVQRVEKKGEDAAVVLADIQRGNIQRARMAFLNLEAEEEENATAEVAPMPQTSIQRFAGMDIEGEEETSAESAEDVSGEASGEREVTPADPAAEPMEEVA